MLIKTLLGMKCVECYPMSFYITNLLCKVANSGILTNDLLHGLLKPKNSETDIGALKVY